MSRVPSASSTVKPSKRLASSGESANLLKSFSYIPLRARQTLGVLALASEDPQRFYPEMGTVYLKRSGEMISAALRPYAEGT